MTPNEVTRHPAEGDKDTQGVTGTPEQQLGDTRVTLGDSYVDTGGSEL